MTLQIAVVFANSDLGWRWIDLQEFDPITHVAYAFPEDVPTSLDLKQPLGDSLERHSLMES
jgi:hypothetical protein